MISKLIRSVTDLDREKLPTFSYSKLDLFDSCTFKYKIKYIDGFRSEEDSLVLELGTIAHKGYELKYRSILEGKEIDYDYIIESVTNGIEEQTDKSIKYLNGFNQLKDKYGIVNFGIKCDKSGMNYIEKFKLYIDTLKTETLTDGWIIKAVEQPFEFVYDDKYIIHGFIDRIDTNENEDLRIIDYKTSKAIYADDKIRTPLQMVIYALACHEMYNKLPIEFLYDFLFINQKQQVKTAKLLDKGIIKLNKILNHVLDCEISGEYVPNPTPLCYWCDYSNSSPFASRNTKFLCDYYSNWTPSRKTFSKNKEYTTGGCNKKMVNNPFKF